MTNISRIAQELQNKYMNDGHFDFNKPEEDTHHQDMQVDPSVVLEEHEGTPRSYMVFNNLKTIIMDASDLLSIMNEKDVLPAWTQEMISNAKMNVSKALDYVRAEKTED